MKWLFSLALLMALLTAPAQAGQVVASIKPLHSLVAAIMQGDDNVPVLLVDGTASPHDFSLRPSQMRSLEKADIVFYMGDSFETFLGRVLETLPPSIVRAPMQKAHGVTLYPWREGDGMDLHLWLSPANAKAMSADIAQKLSALYPQKKSLYEANEKKLEVQLDALDKQLAQRMRPLQGRPFVVFHDGFQYFEKDYGLNEVGSITIIAERMPGAKHLKAIRDKIQSVHAACVFREPEFDARTVDSLVAGTGAKSGMLDPEATQLTPGPQLYFKMMDTLAKGFEDCLGSP